MPNNLTCSESYFISKSLRFIYIGYRCDRRYFKPLKDQRKVKILHVKHIQLVEIKICVLAASEIYSKISESPKAT